MEVKPGYKQTEVGVIPEEWDAVPLKGKVGIAHGFAFASEHFARHGLYRLATPGHFYETGGFRDIGEKQKYYVGPVPNDYVLQPGDVIIAMTEQADGLLGSAAVIPEEHVYLHNQRLGRVTVLSSEIQLDYLVYVFNSPSYRTKVRETAAGTKVKHTSPEKLLDISVQLPPPSEQRDIAEALSDVDGLLGGLDRLIAKKRDLKQAAMQQLLTGQTRLPGFGSRSASWQRSTFGEFPTDWKLQPLSRVSAFITKGSTPTTYGFEWVSSGVLFLRSECVSERGLDLSQSMFVSPKAHQLLRRSEVKSDDILMTITGNVGRVVHLDDEFQPCNINQHIARIRITDDQVAATFVFHFLSQPLVRKYYSQITTGQAYPQISLTQVRNTVLPMPSLPEQTAIAEVLSDMDAELAALTQRRDKTRALKQAMMQELLTGRTRLVAHGDAENAENAEK